MNDYSYHTVSSIINAFQKSVNFPFKFSNFIVNDLARFLQPLSPELLNDLFFQMLQGMHIIYLNVCQSFDNHQFSCMVFCDIPNQ